MEAQSINQPTEYAVSTAVILDLLMRKLGSSTFAYKAYLYRGPHFRDADRKCSTSLIRIRTPLFGSTGSTVLAYYYAFLLCLPGVIVLTLEFGPWRNILKILGLL